jgi:hypothetical protein
MKTSKKEKSVSTPAPSTVKANEQRKRTSPRSPRSQVVPEIGSGFHSSGRKILSVDVGGTHVKFRVNSGDEVR